MRISHYELLQPIGRDGASEIFRARDLRLDREVAVKLLRPEEIARPGAVELFRREARLASLVTHPHVCAVHESGEESGQPFLVCELLEGRALDEIIAGRPLPGDRLLDIAAQLADALNAIHRRGLVHGGLKPSNVFITNDGHVKVLELGAVGAATPDRPRGDVGRASQTTTVNISPPRPVPVGNVFHAYLAPEQIAGSGADYRADIFALGALIYEMATGRAAVQRRNAGADRGGHHRTRAGASAQPESGDARRARPHHHARARQGSRPALSVRRRAASRISSARGTRPCCSAGCRRGCARGRR